MKSVLICPAERPALAKLAGSAPLAVVPILGQSLLEYWLEHLASLGAREVQVLAADRSEEVRAHVGDGARWGLRVEVMPEVRELTISEARAKYRETSGEDWLPDPKDVVLLDQLPGMASHTLLNSYGEWFAAVLAWFSHTASPLRVGIHEIQPGVWAGLRTRIAPTAQLHAPCWLGQNVWIGPQAVIGPMVVVEDRVFVESGATISHSVVGTETFVGSLTDLRDSLACGSTLVNWRTGSSLELADPLLLCPLHRRRTHLKRPNVMARLAALWLMVGTFPAAACVMWRSKRRGRPALRQKIAICPRLGTAPSLNDELIYYELGSVSRWLRRWPQLWNIMRGEFTWVGNRPISPEDAGALRNDSERLWLTAPIGLISLADATGCAQAFSDEARAHASFYAVKANWKLDCAIFARAIAASLFRTHHIEQEEESPMPFPTRVLNREVE